MTRSEIITDILKEARWVMASVNWKFLEVYSPKRKQLIVPKKPMIEQALKDKKIWNADFAEFKQLLEPSELHDRSMHFLLDLRDDLHLPKDDYENQDYKDWEEVYWAGTFSGMHDFKSALKKMKMLSTKLKPGSPAQDIVNKWLKEFGELENAAVLLDSLKPIRVKGRKPKPSTDKPPGWERPRSSPADIAKVGGVIKEFTQKLEKQLEKNYENLLRSMTARYFKDRKNKDEDLYAYARRINDKAIVSLIGTLVRPGGGEGVGSRFEPTEKVKNYEAIVKSDSKRYADDVIARFTYKNQAKLASIVGKKGGLKSTRVGNVYTSRGDIEGEMRFDFDDGSGFTARNKVVTVWNRRGHVFNRFPTTFHDVVMPDGKKHKKVSEEWMNKSFA